MALYIDSAYLDDITNIVQTVPVVGVTTNPSILLAAQTRGQALNMDTLIAAILERLNPWFNQGLIFLQPGAMDEAEMYRQVLFAWQAVTRAGYETHRLVHKLPMTPAGMRVAQRLKKNQPEQRIAFTAVTTVAQAYTAAMIGANFVIPYYNRLERAGVDARERIAEIAELFHNQRITTRILAASIKSPTEAALALLAGTHDITAAPQVLLDMLSDPLTDEAIEKFADDWQKMNKV